MSLHRKQEIRYQVPIQGRFFFLKYIEVYTFHPSYFAENFPDIILLLIDYIFLCNMFYT